MRFSLFILLLLFSCFSVNLFGQVLPPDRSVDWTNAGLKDTTTANFTAVNLADFGVVGDGTTPNDSIVQVVIDSFGTSGLIMELPAGDYMFNYTIRLNSNTVLRGQGAENTTILMNPIDSFSNGISIRGFFIDSIQYYTPFTSSALKGASSIEVTNASSFTVGDWIHLRMSDTALVVNSWAEGTVGQIVQITNIINNELQFDATLRIDFDIANDPYIRQLYQVENVGIECLKLERVWDSAPYITRNINLYGAVNCWVSGIESENCTWAHFAISNCSNLYIGNNYIHHGFSYGVNGRAYGVMLYQTSNECLIENNIFEHLRHSILLQSGANGNVIAFNYSFDPYWLATGPLIPTDAAGDMVLHGNYPFANLFEQNICQNIVIDNSHGANGPYNTFLRNRAEKFGIFFSAANSPSQNFIGNEVPNTSFPYSVANYSIGGPDQFIYGNNNKGTIDPPGTEMLTDISYYYAQKPDFVLAPQWGGIGTPNVLKENKIPAYNREKQNIIFAGVCGNPPFTTAVESPSVFEEDITVYPNPFLNTLTLDNKLPVHRLSIVNSLGETVYQLFDIQPNFTMSTANWATGVFYVVLENAEGGMVTEKVIRME